MSFWLHPLFALSFFILSALFVDVAVDEACGTNCSCCTIILRKVAPVKGDIIQSALKKKSKKR